MDLAKLRDICVTGESVDESLLVQLLGMFLADNRERVAALRSAVQAHDVEQARRVAHTLAGSAGTAGAMSLCAMARAVEALAVDGKLPDPAALTAIESEFARVEALMRTSYPAISPTA
jgi:HPt (histidine-containing phosphotransfer) domain-containing protein